MQTQLQKVMPRLHARGRFRASLFVLIFCYLLSGQALASRDPIGESVDWHIYVQVMLFFASICIAAGYWVRNGRRPHPSPYVWWLVAFGSLAMVSSFRSFWPPLSVVKGCIFLLVVLFGEMVCNTFPPAVILRNTYYAIILLFATALLTGIAMPSTYPLLVHNVVGRQRLALFTDDFGDFAYLAGMGFFIGRVSAVRAAWYFQLFLVVLTLASGSRSCTCALIFIVIATRLLKSGDFRLTAVKGATVVIVAASLLLFQNSTTSLAGILDNRLQGFYGSTALAESPWQLSGRLELWEAAAGIFKRSIFLGFGFDGTRNQLLRIFPWAGGAHNAFLELLLTAGGVGLLAFIVAIASVVRTCFGSAETRSTLPIFCFLLIVASTGHSFTMFRDFGVFLAICVQHWNDGLAIQQRHRATTICAKFAGARS